MKQLVLKVPTFVFAIPVLLPLLILALQIISEKELFVMEYLQFLKPISKVVVFAWLFSIVHYFQSKAPNFKYLKSIYLLLFIDLTLEIILWIFFPPFAFNDLWYSVISLVQFFNFVALTTLLTMLIHTVFYERSVWFIILEIFTIVVGILTLTPEIKRSEKR